MTSESKAPPVAIVVLTMGDRPTELGKLCQSLAGQPAADRLIVGNGSEPPAIDGWRTIQTAENLGVPGGRTAGLRSTTADFVLFVDDDAVVRSPDLVARMARHFDDSPNVAAVALRIVEPGGERSARRWSPRIGLTNASGLRDVPTFPGGGHALRRSAFEQVGGYVDEFFFKHEETELSWKLIDAGWRIVFDPDAVIEHPATAEFRHSDSLAHSMRNKTWLARLRLPQPLPWLTIAISVLRTLARTRSREELVAVARGLREGAGTLPTARNSIGWRTVWQLARLGRPPIF